MAGTWWTWKQSASEHESGHKSEEKMRIPGSWNGLPGDGGYDGGGEKV
jgi:hypothetical protein